MSRTKNLPFPETTGHYSICHYFSWHPAYHRFYKSFIFIFWINQKVNAEELKLNELDKGFLVENSADYNIDT